VDEWRRLSISAVVVPACGTTATVKRTAGQYVDVDCVWMVRVTVRQSAVSLCQPHQMAKRELVCAGSWPRVALQATDGGAAE